HAPRFVFAHYNLGHACFLQGRFAEARDAYEAGLAEDPQPSARQRCRAALAHAAANDTARAAAYVERALNEVDGDARDELVDEIATVLRALRQVDGIDVDAIARLLGLVER